MRSFLSVRDRREPAMLRTLLALGFCIGLTSAQDPHVLELTNSDDATYADVLAIFNKCGVSEGQAKPLIEKVSKEGNAVVMAGNQESLTQVAKLFEEAKLKATVRPLQKGDLPEQKQNNNNKAASKYAGSDVIEADKAMLAQLMQDKNGGALVVFYAPWCGPCQQMVPNVKKAATMLKEKGIKVAAINSDAEPGLAQSLGIRGFPTVKWVANGKMSDYAGDRSAMDLASFAQQQHTVGVVKAKVAGAVSGVKQMGKLAMSKVLSRGQAAMQGAVQPATAAAA